jgi:hypothetical protein
MTSVPHYDHRFHAIVVGKIPSSSTSSPICAQQNPCHPLHKETLPTKKSCKALSFSDWNLACFRSKLEISKLHCFVFFASVLVCLQFVAIVVLVALRRSLEED